MSLASECPNCKGLVPRPWLAREVECSSCGATLRVDNESAKRFVYRAEAVLIAVGFLSTSEVTYALLAALAVAALAVYVGWSLRSPLRVYRL
jgi:hypothetical protein